MSLKSMTGHGRGAAAVSGVKVEVELSSVNRKQADVSIRLPRSLEVLEPRVEEEVHRVVSRGRVTGEVFIRTSEVARRKGVRVDEGLARTYLRAIRKTGRRVGLEDDLRASLLLALPDVVRYEQPTEDADRIWPIVQKALRGALKNLVQMRVREGAALQEDLAARFRKMAARVQSVRKRAPGVVANFRKKLLARLQAAGFTMQSSDERLLRELAFFADRSDITEELTRLDSHIRQAHKLMQSREPAGRSLDFLAQEMLREANTMGSKANDSEIVKDVVALKAELERIREQVQNIE